MLSLSGILDHLLNVMVFIIVELSHLKEIIIC